MKAARDVTGPDMPITIDTNCPWTVDEAIAMAHKFQAFNPMWLEEPVWPPEDHVGLARVRAAGGLAIAAGENATTSDFKRMFEVGAVTYAQPSITKVGGVTEMRKVMALAQAFGVSVVPHSAYFGPGSWRRSIASRPCPGSRWSNATIAISPSTRCTTPSIRATGASPCRRARARRRAGCQRDRAITRALTGTALVCVSTHNGRLLARGTTLWT